MGEVNFPFHDTIRLREDAKIRVRVKNVAGQTIVKGDCMIWAMGETSSRTMCVEYHADTAQATLVRAAGVVDDAAIDNNAFGYITLDGIMDTIKVFHSAGAINIDNGYLMKLASHGGEAVKGAAQVVATGDKGKGWAFAIGGENFDLGATTSGTGQIKGYVMRRRV